MNIAIVGAGISGLSLYLFLEKHAPHGRQHSITIFEARDTATQDPPNTEQAISNFNASVIGASLGLSTTGLKVLERLDPDLYTDVLSTGHVLRRCKITNARGSTLADVPVGAEDEIVVMIGREAFRRRLQKRVPASAISRRKVQDVVSSSAGLASRLVFKDGGHYEADLVVGADGIWSTIRTAMLREHMEGAHDYSPHYEGLVRVSRFVPASKLAHVPEGEMNIVFGANGFFGFTYTEPLESMASLSETSAMWWSTYSLKSCPEDWRKIDREDVISQLRERHHNWNNETVQNILRDVSVDSLYPTFVTPLLPTWHGSRIVLVGDAAHALQPSSGQGASMALEDCETLALLLKHFIDLDLDSGCEKALSAYSAIRMPRLEMVHRRAQEVGSMKQDMSFVQEMIMYFFIWLVNAFRLNEAYNRRLNDYDVTEHVKQYIDNDSNR